MVTDLAGHILRKTENGALSYYFYANDKPIGSTNATGAADFDFNYTPVSEQFPATTPNGYVVTGGETLRSIALAVYGDAQLWYLIADANGLHSDADLKVGKSLTIPNRVSNLHNDYKTFKPYAPGQIVGDTTPSLPDPPPPPAHGGGGGCGGLGGILVSIVAIVVTALVAPYLAPYLGGAGSLGVAAGAAAIGSFAGQVAGNILGVQHGFNFAGIAVAALTAGITQGLVGGVGGTPPTDFGKSLDVFGRAIVGNVIGQGVGILTGQQHGFSWAAVAGSAVSAAVTQGLTTESGSSSGDPVTAKLGMGSGSPVAALVGGIAGGVVSQVLSGGRVNFAQIAADSFGNVLGEHDSRTHYEWGGAGGEVERGVGECQRQWR